MKLNLIIILISVFTSFNLAGQNLDEVFDDGGLSTVKNNVNFSVSDMIEGFFTLGYQRYIGERSSIGLDVGVFLFTGPKMHYPYGFSSYYDFPDSFEKGYLLHFRYRHYRADHDGLFWQYGVLFHTRSVNNKDYTFLSLPEIKLGYRFKLYELFYISASIGGGVAFYTTKNSYDGYNAFYASDAVLYFPLNIDIAYDF